MEKFNLTGEKDKEFEEADSRLKEAVKHFSKMGYSPDVVSVVLDDILYERNGGLTAKTLVSGKQFRGEERERLALNSEAEEDWGYAALNYLWAAEFALSKRKSDDAKKFYQKAGELKIKEAKKMCADEGLKFEEITESLHMPSTDEIIKDIKNSLEYIKNGTSVSEDVFSSLSPLNSAKIAYTTAQSYFRIVQHADKAFNLLYEALDHLKLESE